MKCPRCGFDNPAQMKFCGECGQSLAPTCPACGVQNPAGFKFCGECGQTLKRPQVPEPEQEPKSHAPIRRPEEAESERKQVTVMAVELVGAPDPSDPGGAEVLHRVLNGFMRLAQEHVSQYGGVIHQVIGSGFVALFGAPVSHEDHPRRAVLSALAIRLALVESPAELWATAAEPLAVRIGIDTGSVVVGGVGDMVVGPTRELAMRLRRAAAPGEILVSDGTRRQVEVLVELEGAGAVDGDGGESAESFRVTGRAAETGGAFDEQTLSPFVGRSRELSILRELLEQADEGRGQLVGIVGDAGSGKSRLLHELQRGLRGRRVTRLVGSCLSYGTGVPYLPFIQMIRRASHIAEDDDGETTRRKMRSALEEVGLEAEPHLPYLLRLLAIDEGTEAISNRSPQAIQQGTFRAMRRMILTASRRNLVVMELEDLHWMDETSEEFLATLVEEVGAARILILLTYRSGYRPTYLDKSFATQIPMRRLSNQDSQRVVDAILERLGLSAESSEEIVDKGEGNPLFLEELARSLAVRDKHSGAPDVPDTVHDLLMARIDRLPEDHKRLLRTASVLGREGSRELLDAIWEGPPLEGLLTDLKRREFLYEVPGPDRSTFQFKHALAQEVAYGSLLTERRRDLHHRVAQALERLYADRLEEVYDRLVYHYPRAGEVEKTVHYLGLFADQAARGYAHAEAARALYEAISHAERLPEPDRDRRVLELVMKLADSLLPLARFPETLRLLNDQRERVERCEDASLTARHRFWLAHTYSYLGHQEDAVRTAREAIDLATEAEDEATRGKAFYVLGRDGFWAGRFREGLEASLEAVVLLERTGEPWWQGQAYWVAGFHQYVLGDFRAALETMERARKIGETLGDYRLDTSWSVGYFYASLGEWETGIETCRVGLEAARDPLNSAAALGFLGYAHLEKGDVAQAVQDLEETVQRLEGTGMQQLLGWFSVYLGEALLAMGRTEEARRSASRALSLNRDSGFRYGEALALRALGRIEMDAGDPVSGRQRLDAARAQLEELQVPFEVARTDLDLARADREAGESEAAEGRRRQALETFRRLHVPKYLERAEELEGTAG